MSRPTAGSADSMARLSDLVDALRRFIARAADRSEITDADSAEIRRISWLAAVASDQERAGWLDHQKRVERSTHPRVPERVQQLNPGVDQFLAMSQEMVALGSALVPVIRFADGRSRIVAEGEVLLANIGTCIVLAQDREEKDRAWRRRRIDFIEELYARDETRDIMRAFDVLESLTGRDFEKDQGWRSIRTALIQTLQPVLFWSTAMKRPFAFLHLPLDDVDPLHDFRTMREEWKAASSKDGALRVREKHVA